MESHRLIFENKEGKFMFPERCSIRKKGRDCPMPPEFVISVKSSDAEYMVGV